MWACRLSPRHINRFSSHRTAVYAYLLSHGLSEHIDNLIFGRRPWRYRRIGHCRDTTPQGLLTQISEKGYASITNFLPVKDLFDELVNTIFIGRVASEQYTLYELQLMHPTLRGRYDAILPSLFSLETFAKLVTSNTIYQIASSILGHKFLITSAVVWANLPCESETHAVASAQVFHMDYDYLDDIKLFINLTDVDASSGPLEFLVGSHLPSGKRCWSAEPIAEERVRRLHPHLNSALFLGGSGSAYISDNRGLHRDYPPKPRHWKLAMQINFSRNQFGSEQAYSSTRPVLSRDWPSYDIWSAALNSHPFVYSLLFAQLPTLG
jgi:hypothetical protein